MSNPLNRENSFGDQDGMGIAAGIASSDQTSFCSRGIMPLASAAATTASTWRSVSASSRRCQQRTTSVQGPTGRSTTVTRYRGDSCGLLLRAAEIAAGSNSDGVERSVTTGQALGTTDPVVGLAPRVTQSATGTDLTGANGREAASPLWVVGRVQHACG